VGYATTVMKQVGPSYAVGYSNHRSKIATVSTNQCQRAEGKLCDKVTKTKFNIS